MQWFQYTISLFWLHKLSYETCTIHVQIHHSVSHIWQLIYLFNHMYMSLCVRMTNDMQEMSRCPRTYTNLVNNDVCVTMIWLAYIVLDMNNSFYTCRLVYFIHLWWLNSNLLFIRHINNLTQSRTSVLVN